MMIRAGTLIEIVLAAFCAAILVLPAAAHEGHDHDKPPPLNLPVAPRVIAVTPQLELVGVVSGAEQLTVFVHEFATNEPIAGAQLTVSGNGGSVEAEPDGDGVFAVRAPWIASSGTSDLIFALTFADGGEDLLTGRLEVPESFERNPGSEGASQPLKWHAVFIQDQKLMWALGGGFVAGVLLTLLFAGGSGQRSWEPTGKKNEKTAQSEESAVDGGKATPVTPLRQSMNAWIVIAGATIFVSVDLEPVTAAEAVQEQPSIPSTMATDQPQRMPDATLFMPKATQHLLSVRTQAAEKTKASRATELSGRVIAGPQNVGRVQSDRPGRYQAVHAKGSNVPYVGLKVAKGAVIGYVETYIEESDRANIVSQIAEADARIAATTGILNRLQQSKGAVPRIKIDRLRGDLDVLKKKREQLLPSTAARVPLVAPISGIISVANVVAGQVVETRDVLFEIIDPSEFWIEAVAPHPEIASNLASAVATVHDQHRLDLTYMGRGLVLRHHSAILNFKVETPDKHLAVGMTARVLLQSNDIVEGFVLPSSAIVRGQAGLPIVWIKTQPERFEPHVVKFEPFDGDQVVITAGINQDQRIVVDGVTLLNQVR